MNKYFILFEQARLDLERKEQRRTEEEWNYPWNILLFTIFTILNIRNYPNRPAKEKEGKGM